MSISRSSSTDLSLKALSGCICLLGAEGGESSNSGWADAKGGICADGMGTVGAETSGAHLAASAAWNLLIALVWDGRAAFSECWRRVAVSLVLHIGQGCTTRGASSLSVWIVPVIVSCWVVDITHVHVLHTSS